MTHWQCAKVVAVVCEDSAASAPSFGWIGRQGRWRGSLSVSWFLLVDFFNGTGRSPSGVRGVADLWRCREARVRACTWKKETLLFSFEKMHHIKGVRIWFTF